MGRRGSADPSFERVVRRFMEEVRKRLGGKAVAVVAFGSRAWGGYRDDSDYDVFLLHRARDEEAKKAAADAALVVSAELGVAVEPIAMSIYRFHGRDSSFVRRCAEEGVIYYFDDCAAGRGEATDLLMLAEELLEAARELRRRRFYRSALDQACNAVELAVKAMMRWDGHELPTTRGAGWRVRQALRFHGGDR